MRFIVCDNYEKLTEEAVKIISSQLVIKPNSVLGLPEGTTPVGIYQKLAEKCKSGEIDFSEASTFNLDEYYPMNSDDERSCHKYMAENLFDHININPENVHILNGEAEDAQKECKNYEKEIKTLGGIDLQILGLGQNGHIGLNEPDLNLNSETHISNMALETITARTGGEHLAEAPKQALTMGMSTILRAKKIILLASGANKSRVVSELLNDRINTAIPATFLKVHPDVTLICDVDAYSRLRLGVDIGGTSVKFAVVDNGKIIHKRQIDTIKDDCNKFLDAIAKECNEIKEVYPVKSIGIGTPGFIKDGYVSAVNLPFKNVKLDDEIFARTQMPTLVDNDANCAALGEVEFGKGAEHNNIIMITLGTGVGGGIIINKKISHGSNSMGEVGHIIVQNENGIDCGCGQTGCWEQYASVTALIRESTKAAIENPDSILFKIYSENGNTLTGKSVFAALDANCPVAKKVFDEYLSWIAVGIKSLVNVFGPDAIILAGGITNRGEKFIKPLRKKVGNDNVIIEISKLQNDAGALGAAML